MLLATVADNSGRDLILVRHAQTIWNSEGRYQGHLDSPVTAEGRDQIEAVAGRLAGVGVRAVYTSDLGRSLLTADRIARVAHAPVIVDVRLRERNHGLFEGLTKDLALSRYPELVHQVRTTQDPDFAIPFAESKQRLLERVLPVMHEAAQLPGDGAVVVIGHGGMLSAFLNYVADLPVTARNGNVVRNCSISVVAYANGRWRAKSIGDADHLPVLA